MAQKLGLSKVDNSVGRSVAKTALHSVGHLVNWTAATMVLKCVASMGYYSVALKAGHLVVRWVAWTAPTMVVKMAPL